MHALHQACPPCQSGAPPQCRIKPSIHSGTCSIESGPSRRYIDKLIKSSSDCAPYSLERHRRETAGLVTCTRTQPPLHDVRGSSVVHHSSLAGSLPLDGQHNQHAKRLHSARQTSSAKRTIFSAGSMLMDTRTNSLSKKGTRGSRPHAKGALLARRTSHWCRRVVLRIVSLHVACVLWRLVQLSRRSCML